MNNASLFTILGLLIICSVTGLIYTIVMNTGKASRGIPSLDAAEDHQRIDTRDPSLPRFSDKIVIHSSIP